MQRVRLRKAMSFPLAFLLPICLVFIGARSDHAAAAFKARAALTASYHEPSPAIAAALHAQRMQFIADAQATADAEVVENARLAAEVEAQKAEEARVAAEAQAEAEAQAAAEAKASARRMAAAQTAPPNVYAKTTGVSGSGACGGNLPPCYVMERESGGNLTIPNAQGSGAMGKWQFMPGTWASYGGYSSAADAPESVQDARATQIWAGGAGCSNWSAC